MGGMRRRRLQAGASDTADRFDAHRGGELAEFVERVAGEVYRESAPRSGAGVECDEQSAAVDDREFWAKLRRTLAPFDVVDGRLQVAVYEAGEGWKDASRENGQQSAGNGQLSAAAPSARRSSLGRKVKKAATMGRCLAR